jgi:hypothetical protein
MEAAVLEVLETYEQLLMRFGREGQNRQLAAEVSRSRQQLLTAIRNYAARQFSGGLDTRRA